MGVTIYLHVDMATTTIYSFFKPVNKSTSLSYCSLSITVPSSHLSAANKKVSEVLLSSNEQSAVDSLGGSPMSIKRGPYVKYTPKHKA